MFVHFSLNLELFPLHYHLFWKKAFSISVPNIGTSFRNPFLLNRYGRRAIINVIVPLNIILCKQFLENLTFETSKRRKRLHFFIRTPICKNNNSDNFNNRPFLSSIHCYNVTRHSHTLIKIYKKLLWSNI